MKIGTTAPSFTLPDHRGERRSLKQFIGKHVVLYFYPKDNTPGCTLQAQRFNALLPKFRKLGVEVVGVSGGDQKSKEKFCAAHGLKFTLLTDSDFKVAKAYRSFGKKTFMGRSFMGIFRNTFIVDPKGKIAHVFEKVTPEENPDEILSLLAGSEKREPTRKAARATQAPSKRAGAKTLKPKKDASKKRTGVPVRSRKKR